ncbi:hypothetical protein H2198_008415 [Neophaeococcomyces mojaviensis]|uniref:Uncharacterized protein n=1 Tax=Neophaeococcomyces mojaviensis TaxID=3383035 RepID=A0ACC2ZXE8_9EURO|nr:hypothetical protein H2198_008415 [Knufia sp. JES_112]
MTGPVRSLYGLSTLVRRSLGLQSCLSRCHLKTSAHKRYLTTGFATEYLHNSFPDLTDSQLEIRTAISKVCADFPDEYWIKAETEHRFPVEFHRAVADSGFLGICMPSEYGGSDLGISEAAIMVQTIAESGAAYAGASAVHMNIFGLEPVRKFGTEEQKKRMLVPLIAGKERACFGVTEPNTGLETLKLKSHAVKAEDESGNYVLSGRKIWISTAQVAEKILILVRTTPLEEVKKPSHGLSLFYTDLDRSVVEVKEIQKMGRAAVDSNMLFFDDWNVPKEDLIGEEGNGFKMIMHGMNAERVLIAAEALGIGYAALRRAALYAKDREVFGRKIGKNQAIQHPLADSWMQLEAARLMVYQAAHLYDEGHESGEYANAAKYLAAEAAFRACERAVMTHGGMGYAKEYHVERYFREVMIPRIAPVSREMIFNYIGEKVLGLPRSY